MVGSDIDGKLSMNGDKHLSELALVLLERVLVSDLNVELVHKRSEDGAYLEHRDILANADHRAERERHKDILVGDDLSDGDNLARWCGVFVLLDPALGPPGVCEGIEVLRIAVNGIRRDRLLSSHRPSTRALLHTPLDTCQNRRINAQGLVTA